MMMMNDMNNKRQETKNKQQINKQTTKQTQRNTTQQKRINGMKHKEQSKQQQAPNKQQTKNNQGSVPAKGPSEVPATHCPTEALNGCGKHQPQSGNKRERR
jgi:hypothetical protein